MVDARTRGKLEFEVLRRRFGVGYDAQHDTNSAQRYLEFLRNLLWDGEVLVEAGDVGKAGPDAEEKRNVTDVVEIAVCVAPDAASFPLEGLRRVVEFEAGVYEGFGRRANIYGGEEGRSSAGGASSLPDSAVKWFLMLTFVGAQRDRLYCVGVVVREGVDQAFFYPSVSS